MSEFERVRRSCLKRGELWEDPDFPATQNSVFYHQTPPFQFTWRRPKEINNNAIFYEDGATQFDITTGKLGDRWLVSCLGCLHLARGLFYRVVPADQTFDSQDYCGVFRFRLWWGGRWHEVLVDDRLPTVNNKLVLLQSQHTNQFWASLLEKAYAKLHGSYEALKYGASIDGLSDMTGGITETINIKQDPTTCGRILAKLLHMTSVVTCVVQQPHQSRNLTEKLANGITLGVNYRIYTLEKVETLSGEPVQLIRLRNATGFSDYVGSYHCESAEWDNITATDRHRLNIHHMNDGEFWMPYADFVKTFTHLEVIHLDEDTSRDEPSLATKVPWNTRVSSLQWQRGVTAGGCRNNADTFHLNPQFQLVLVDAEEIIVSLTQHGIVDPKVIGFTVYPFPKGIDVPDRSFFKKHRSIMSSQYTNGRQVTSRVDCEQGSFLIVPTTFEPGQEAAFTIRVHSPSNFKFKYLDIIPSVLKSAILRAPLTAESNGFTQYEAVFLQLADEHKSINAFELQELLEACLPNDYVKSCASVEVCRQVLFAFDNESRGRLHFAQFKDLMVSLKWWQSVFRSHSKEKTGILRAERIRDALRDIGYELSSEILSILVLRYMRKDGTLRFGDFVAAVLHLHMAFRIFEKKDPLQNGLVKLNVSQWVHSVLMC